MAKTNGVGWTTLSVDTSGGAAKAIKNDITDLSIATPRGVQDITGLDSLGNERQLLLVDMSEDLTGVVNVAADASHDVFKTVPSTSVARTVTNTVAGVTLAAEMLPTDYAWSRSTTGELMWKVPLVLANGAVPTWA